MREKILNYFEKLFKKKYSIRKQKYKDSQKFSEKQYELTKTKEHRKVANKNNANGFLYKFIFIKNTPMDQHPAQNKYTQIQ